MKKLLTYGALVMAPVVFNSCKKGGDDIPNPTPTPTPTTVNAKSLMIQVSENKYTATDNSGNTYSFNPGSAKTLNGLDVSAIGAVTSNNGTVGNTTIVDYATSKAQAIKVYDNSGNLVSTVNLPSGSLLKAISSTGVDTAGMRNKSAVLFNGTNSGTLKFQ